MIPVPPEYADHPAISVIFHGKRFRTKSEAKWAVFLDALGIPFYYEPSHYRLPSGLYLPDFWLPTLDTYLEVKPSWLSDPRHYELGQERGKRVYVVRTNIPYVPRDRSEVSVLAQVADHIWQAFPQEPVQPFPQEPVRSYMFAREAQGRINIVPVVRGSLACGHDPDILDAYQLAAGYSFGESNHA